METTWLLTVLAAIHATLLGFGVGSRRTCTGSGVVLGLEIEGFVDALVVKRFLSHGGSACSVL